MTDDLARRSVNALVWCDVDVTGPDSCDPYLVRILGWYDGPILSRAATSEGERFAGPKVTRQLDATKPTSPLDVLFVPSERLHFERSAFEPF